MGPGINTKDGWEAQPALSADGKLLFYTTLRKGSRDNDIYYSERQRDGTWSLGKPFDIVNTAGKDKSPFFHQDGETLYFVSASTDQRKGIGGLDIFYIRKEKGTWTAPKNIGYPINSTQDELGLFVSTNGKIAYYSSLKDGNWNIYSFELYPEARPQEVVILKGELLDENKQVITDAEVEITNHQNGDKSTFKVNGDDGKYAAVVKVNQPGDLTITVKKDGFAFNAKVIDTEALKENTAIIPTTNFVLEVLEKGKTYNINDILFATDSYEIPNRSKIILNGFCDYLKENPTLKIAILGHTDDVGDAKENLQLSTNRSEEVKNYLIEKGIDKERINAVGFGESKPKIENTNEENRSINRRTEFQLLEQ
jgi:outer membrane protein OmpA-like peptidoglycan-associated protein